MNFDMNTLRSLDAPTNDHYSLTREDLNLLDGPDADVWYRRMEVCVEELEYLEFHPMQSPRGGSSRWHIPPEFPDGDYDYEENDVINEPPYCERVSLTDRVRAKSPAVFPPLYRDPCAYCVYKFVHWWARCATIPDPDNDPRPDAALEL